MSERVLGQTVAAAEPCAAAPTAKKRIERVLGQTVAAAEPCAAAPTAKKRNEQTAKKRIDGNDEAMSCRPIPTQRPHD
jgi:hypothetical protein